MPSATLNFNLDNPADSEAFVTAVKAKNLWIALFDIDQQIMTHADDQTVQKFWEILDRLDITLEELS